MGGECIPLTLTMHRLLRLSILMKLSNDNRVILQAIFPHDEETVTIILVIEK